jgi:hypothetical protein
MWDASRLCDVGPWPLASLIKGSLRGNFKNSRTVVMAMEFDKSASGRCYEKPSRGVVRELWRNRTPPAEVRLAASCV